LRITGGRGETLIHPVQATDDPATIGPVDFVLFCVKLWDVESAGEAIRPLVGPDTAVIPFQNGIDAPERLVPILGAGAVMGGVAQISATIAEPGVIRQTGSFMRLVFGELAGGKSDRGEAFLSLCHKAGFDASHSAAILTDLWMKFILLATNSAVTSATRSPFGKLRDDPEVMALFEAGFHEVAAVGRARGVALPNDAEAKMVAATKAFPPDMMASMAHDLLRGGRIELPWLSGKVVALGRELGVPTPVHAVLHAVLKPFTAGTR
jgi:2-dehydropantoate 2-reductase